MIKKTRTINFEFVGLLAVSFLVAGDGRWWTIFKDNQAGGILAWVVLASALSANILMIKKWWNRNPMDEDTANRRGWLILTFWFVLPFTFFYAVIWWPLWTRRHGISDGVWADIKDAAGSWWQAVVCWWG